MKAPGFRRGKSSEFLKSSTVDRKGGRRGAGLGLAICRGVVELHGGRIWAENRPAGGAAIHFMLPIIGAPLDRHSGTARTGWQPRSNDRNAGSREDFGDRRRAGNSPLPAFSLVSHDFELIEAERVGRHPASGTAATGPDHTGPWAFRTWTALEVIRQVRAVVSRVADHRRFGAWTRARKSALDAGADDYLTKPFGIDELTARIGSRHAASRCGQRPTGEATYRSRRHLRVDLADARYLWRARNTPDADRVSTCYDAHSACGQVATHRQFLKRCGGRQRTRRRTTSACSWRNCATKSSRTPHTRDCYSLSRGWATGWRPNDGI